MNCKVPVVIESASSCIFLDILNAKTEKWKSVVSRKNSYPTFGVELVFGGKLHTAVGKRYRSIAK